ncbi:hypothetical protein NBT05_06510 [Aquimarina sp. ERC-38]|uniref:hypothetical protein n=1 Tax=Aquimarina sp. ERC-38 TaxID=2949996 RepID=UPI0022456058|nr:hypothetical protein [Aquimarina sp. ERC-38]UZO82119.1 hypothetical protein NBT05_06510 [Aquimarina sp. ERC-38]
MTLIHPLKRKSCLCILSVFSFMVVASSWATSSLKNHFPGKERDSLTLNTKKNVVTTTPVAQFRTFPSLDKQLLENKSFTLKTVQKQAEFNSDFLAANFPKNPAVDKLIAQAKAAFDQIKELQNFAEVISGKELLELPVGLSKKDKTSGNKVELAITEVKFLPKYAEFKAWARLKIPVKKDNETSQDRELYFGAEGIKLSKEGALIGDMKLVLLGEQAIPINGDNWLLNLKGDINLKNGAFQDKSYIEFDCSGLKAIGLEGDLRISRNILLPLDKSGNYICGNTNIDNKENSLDAKCYVSTDFTIKADGWNDLLATVSLPRFEVVGLKGWSFYMKKAVIDLSDSRNADNINFPEEYKNIFSEEDQSLWRGIYAKQVEVALPRGIKRIQKGKERVSFGAKDLVIDSYGVSGSFYGRNVLNVGEGAAGQWGFSIDTVGITLAVNKLKSGGIKGGISVPIIKKPMDYEGWIAPREYGLKVKLKEQVESPAFLGSMTLEKNSSVSVKVKEDKVYPYANLTGELSLLGKIGQKEGDAPVAPDDLSNSEVKGKAFNIKGITFQELELQTEPGQAFIQVKKFGYEGEMNLMAFPATIKNLNFITPTKDQAGLSFDLTINLDKEGSYASTNLQVLGKLPSDTPVHTWKFHKIKVGDIDVKYEKSGCKLAGKLKIMEDDPTYGDGFSGELEATFEKLKFKANAKAMFGAKDFRYWFVDIWADRNKDASRKKLNIDAFVGGLSNRMKKVSGNENGWTPSSAVYVPDDKTGLNLRAGVQISAKNKDAFSGKAFLEMQFNVTGGLSRIGFTGEGTMMSKDKSSNPISKTVLTKFEKKINGFVEKNQKKIAKLLAAGDYLGLSKEAIPQRDIASQGKVGVFIGIQRDLDRDTFDGTFELYLNTKGVRGGGENNLAGMVKLHTSPSDWYIYVGTPQQRISLVFEVGSESFEIGGYFMTGTKLPSQLPPHPRVTQILGDDILDKNRKSNQLKAAKGFAFGLNFAYRRSFEFAIFYAFLEVGAGFDVMHAYYPNAQCKGRNGPLGNDGWYSTGQVYAYLYGEFGVEVDLAFIKGKYKIAEAGIAALLRGQFPNPAYFEGYVGMYYSILGGLVSGNMRMKVEFGEECELVGVGDAVGVPIISDVSPADKANKIDVFTAPQAIFNYQANKEFVVETPEGRRTFRLQLKEFKLSSQGKNIEGNLEWNDSNDGVTFNPIASLPSQKRIDLIVEVSFEEKINGSFVVMTEDGKLVTEKREISFTTYKAPDHIQWSNVAYLYPIPKHKNFHPEEYKTGYVKLVQTQDYLFDIRKYKVVAEFQSATNTLKRTEVAYSSKDAMLSFDIASLDLNADYKLNLLVFPAGKDIPSEVVLASEEVNYGKGDTNWYDPASDTTEKNNTQGTTKIITKKAGSTKVNNAAPKLILDYAFHTSQFAKFKDKVQAFNYTGYLTIVP